MASPLTQRRVNSQFTLSFETDLAQFSREADAASRWAVPYAAAAAMSKTAYEARQAEIAQMPKVFDRPNALTQKAVLYRKASKDNLTFEVYLRDEIGRSGTPPQRYLEAEILGGARRPKPFENRLRSVGILSSNEFAIPAVGMPLNRYGNLPASVISKILSQLQARRNVGVMQNTTKRSAARNKARGGAVYFVPDMYSALPRGVYQRMARRRIRAVLIFVSAVPTYRKRYAFGEAAIETATKVFGPHWVAAFQKITEADLKRH